MIAFIIYCVTRAFEIGHTWDSVQLWCYYSCCSFEQWGSHNAYKLMCSYLVSEDLFRLFRKMAPVMECLCVCIFWWRERKCKGMNNMFTILQVFIHISCYSFERWKSFANFLRRSCSRINILVLLCCVNMRHKKWRLLLTCANCQLPSHGRQNSCIF